MPVIKCDRCGKESEFAPVYRREGELELLFLKCPECDTEYLSTVTDRELRSNIEAYQDMAKAICAGDVTEAFVQDAQALYRENVTRGKRLRDRYLEL